MKVLVTGGAGYVGTTLLPLLLDRGYEVTVMDNLMYGGAALVPFFRRPNFHFVTGDVRDPDALAGAVRGMDVIVHLAAIVGYPACLKEPRLATEVNLEAAQSLASIVQDDQLVLFASTGSNYGALGDAARQRDLLERALRIELRTGLRHLISNIQTPKNCCASRSP